MFKVNKFDVELTTHHISGAGKHVEIDDRLKFVAAELTCDEGWAEAPEDCTYVLYVASPMPRALTKNEYRSSWLHLQLASGLDNLVECASSRMRRNF